MWEKALYGGGLRQVYNGFSERIAEHNAAGGFIDGGHIGCKALQRSRIDTHLPKQLKGQKESTAVRMLLKHAVGGSRSKEADAHNLSIQPTADTFVDE